MRKKLFLVFILLLVHTRTQAQNVPPPVAQLNYSLDFILDYVLSKKKLTRDPVLPVPGLFLKSVTAVEVFQKDIVDQWGFAPNFITNAYSIKTNRIYLMDDNDYYVRAKRCIDDSLAHELTHYVQVVYKKWDLNDESLEWDAVDIQTQFREEFCPSHENSRISKIRYKKH